MSHSDMLPSLLLKINENQLALLRNAERPRSVEIFAGPGSDQSKQGVHQVDAGSDEGARLTADGQAC